ncbi:actin cytoskeleton-regulatory complex protein pan-1-like [Drosophila yakuba]|uniref:actin cytoskeleton-regulatory complex protein pan-1-like n=1 Tax=Drosophila yakuba TaxID=7245 RepID=UPI001C894521|nr:actin cytoskeleton-regulatory complex protein pan-1-like [Drosophila yakuba]
MRLRNRSIGRPLYFSRGKRRDGTKQRERYRKDRRRELENTRPPRDITVTAKEETQNRGMVEALAEGSKHKMFDNRHGYSHYGATIEAGRSESESRRALGGGPREGQEDLEAQESQERGRQPGVVPVFEEARRNPRGSGEASAAMAVANVNMRKLEADRLVATKAPRATVGDPRRVRSRQGGAHSYAAAGGHGGVQNQSRRKEESESRWQQELQKAEAEEQAAWNIVAWQEEEAVGQEEREVPATPRHVHSAEVVRIGSQEPSPPPSPTPTAGIPPTPRHWPPSPPPNPVFMSTKGEMCRCQLRNKSTRSNGSAKPGEIEFGDSELEKESLETLRGQSLEILEVEKESAESLNL